MLKQPITFIDFNDVERSEDIYFNLTEAELVDWQADSEFGIQKEMNDAVAAKDMRRLLDFIKDLVFRAYGERDKDGIHFNKSKEISQRFVNSAMYSPLLMALFADEGEATTNFINGLMPADLVKRAMEQANIPNPDRDAASNGVKPDARELFAQAQASVNESALEAGRPNVGSPIGTRRENREEQTLNEQTGFAPSLPVQSSHSPLDAAPVQVDRVEEPQPFRVQEDPIGAPVDEGYAEYLRRKANGEIN